MNANMRIWIVMLIGAGVPPAVLVAQPAGATARTALPLTILSRRVPGAAAGLSVAAVEDRRMGSGSAAVRILPGMATGDRPEPASTNRQSGVPVESWLRVGRRRLARAGARVSAVMATLLTGW